MYGLVFTMVGCVGIAAGFLLITSDWAFWGSTLAVIDRCELKFPAGSGFGNLSSVNRCAAVAYRHQGLLVLAVAAVVVAATAALILIVPWVDRWRLARAGRRSIAGAAVRFESLCDASGLTGRRRPRLAVPGLRARIRSAFTIALPGRRPLIVIPAAVAVTYAADTGWFDAVVLHEMAHVRRGDSSWVSCVRWIAWITIPAVALACIPSVFVGGIQVSRAAVIQAGVFAAAAVVIAAWLLRSREVEADRQAARWSGSADGLRCGLLDAERVRAQRGSRWWLRPLARHPSATARIRALQDPAGIQSGGFIDALITGAVAAMAMNASFFVTGELDIVADGWLPERVSAVVAGAVLGFGLTPALIRRAMQACDDGVPARWWQPVSGAAAGIALGPLIAPSTIPAPGAAAVSIITGSGAWDIATRMLLTASAAAGITALAASLATLAVGRGPHPGWLRTAGPAAAIACCGAAALWVLAYLDVGSYWPIERAWLTIVLPGDKWRWLALAYPLAALLLMIPPRPWRPRASTRQALAPPGPAPEGARQARSGAMWFRATARAGIIPLCAATAAAVLALPHAFPHAGASVSELVRAGEQQWWISCLAAWAVLAVLTAAGGISGLARAWISAWVTCLLTGVALVIYGGVTGHFYNFGIFALRTTTPSVWLFYLAVPTSCLAILGGRDAAAATRPRILAPVAAVTAATAAAIVITTGIPGLLPPPQPTPSGPTPTDTASPARTASPSPTPLQTADPGRELTAAAAQQVLDAAGAALPSSWQIDKTTLPPVGHLVVTPAACIPLAEQTFTKLLPAPAAGAARRYKTEPPIIYHIIRFRIESFSRPVPAALFTAAAQALRACHRFTETDSSGFVLRFTPHGAPMHSHVQGWRVDFTTSSGPGGKILGSLTWIVAATGHNLIFITQQTIATATQPAPDDAAISAVLTALTNARGTQPSASS
jgi:Zn-dependent protease with chaperone function